LSKLTCFPISAEDRGTSTLKNVGFLASVDGQCPKFQSWL